MSATSSAPTVAWSRDTALGLGSALTAFFLWGLFPIYWRQLSWVPAMELVLHRALWGTLCFLGFGLLLGQGRALLAVAKNPRTLRWLVLSGTLLAINFLTFLFAVEAGRVVEVSLGYFLNPVLNVLLGVVVLREQLSRAGWLATALASAGVLVMGSAMQGLPWIALTLAFAFGLYGLVRKTIAVDAIAGNTVEMALLCVPACIGIVYVEASGAGQFLHASPPQQLWLASTGIATALPLWAFTAATRRLQLSTIGFMQYIAPSLQLATAVLLFGEAFTPRHSLAFGLIWASLAVFAWSRSQEARAAYRRAQKGQRLAKFAPKVQGVASASGEG